MNKILNLKHLQSVLFVMLCAFLSTTFVACSDDDDDEPTNGLAGTTWTVTASDEEMEGASFTFNADGSVTMKPSQEWSYMKWSLNGKKLKIVMGEGEPDDYIEGNLDIDGNNATYVYKWYDCSGEWGSEETHSMTLKRK